MNNEVAHAGEASSIDSPEPTAFSLSSGPAQSSSCGTVMAAGRPAPEGSNVVVTTVAESLTTQPTARPTIREMEIGNQSNDKRLVVLASRPDRTRDDVNACKCRRIVFAACPEDRDGWTQLVVDWSKKRSGAKSGHLGHLFESQKVSESRIKEFATAEKVEVAEINKPPQVRGVYITLDRQTKHGGTKGCSVWFGQAKIHSPECRARFQDIVDNEAAQTAAASASEPNVETPGQAAGGPAPSSSSGPAPAAGGPAPEDVNMGAAESSTAQPTISVVRTLETEDDGSAKPQRLMAGLPILHETDVDVNLDAHKMVFLVSMPDHQGQWTQRVIDWDKKYYGAKSGTLLDSRVG